MLKWAMSKIKMAGRYDRASAIGERRLVGGEQKKETGKQRR